MKEIFLYLSANPFLIYILIGLLVFVIFSAISVYVIAFRQGREISFWPPTIGNKQLVDGSSSLSKDLPKIYDDKELLFGRIIPKDIRSEISQGFTRPTIRSIRIFGGDIRNWFEEDISTYIALRNRDVEINVLTDNPTTTAINTGKAHGINFCLYPDISRTPPFRGSIFDAEDETECRALVVRRRAPRANHGKNNNYEYFMKSYHGPDDFQVIRSLSILFDELFLHGKKL